MHSSAASLPSHVTQPALTGSHQYHPRPSSSADSPTAHLQLGACTPHDPPSLKYSVEDILQIILKSRKSWKTLKGQSEAVWPPYLEATMLKALQEYEPDDSRETRILGRYPMRNRFISDYIHTTTGKYRSAKQVGSRLQQLRDTPEGRDLIEVLTRCYHTRTDTNAQDRVSRPTSWASSSPSLSTISGESSPSSPSVSPAPSTSSAMSRFPPTNTRQPIESRMPVYIDILPPQSLWSSAGYAYGSSSASAALTSTSDGRPLDAARQIQHIDPTVTFVSPSPVNGRSSYIVLLDGAPVHSEDAPLEYVGPYLPSSSTGRAHGDAPTLYNTPLVPKYWDVLCKSADPTLYTIVQDVYRVPDRVANQSYLQRPRPVKIFSAIYHFRYPPSADSTPSYGQSPVDALRSGSSALASQLADKTLFGNVAPPQITSGTMYPAVATEASTQMSTEVDQYLFDEPFMLDINFDDFNINASSSDATSSSQYYSHDPYYM